MGYSPWGLKESDTTEPLSTAQHSWPCLLPNQVTTACIYVYTRGVVMGLMNCGFLRGRMGLVVRHLNQ